jgi:hypothetical protein
MKNKTWTGWFFESLIVALGIASLLLMLVGTYLQEWWASFGLVIFMTSLLSWSSIFLGARRAQGSQ